MQDDVLQINSDFGINICIRIRARLEPTKPRVMSNSANDGRPRLTQIIPVGSVAHFTLPLHFAISYYASMLSLQRALLEHLAVLPQSTKLNFFLMIGGI